MGDFYGIARDSHPLTEGDLVEAADRVRKNYGSQEIELHHHTCPKLARTGLACRCGAAPLEAIFDDEVARIFRGDES